MRVVLAALAVWSALTAPALARDTRSFLFFSGADFSSLSAFSWAGVEAPFRPDGSGFLLRAMGGFGAYDHGKEGAPDGEVRGTVMLGEVMAGWRHIQGDVCITILAGMAVEDHELDVPDPENTVQGTATGVKIAAELYWRPTERLHVEASAAYAATFDFWRVRLAAGHSFGRFAIGPEFEAFGNEGSHQIRGGVVVSDMKWKKYTFKGAFGALSDGDNTGAYGRLSMDRRF